MENRPGQYQSPDDEFIQIMELAEAATLSRSLDELAARILPTISRMADSPSMLLYFVSSHSPGRKFFHYGVKDEQLAGFEEFLTGLVERFQASMQSQTAGSEAQTKGSFIYYPLIKAGKCVGLIGLTTPGAQGWAGMRERIFNLISGAISRLDEQAEIEKRLTHLNAYLTVSSMLDQSMGLQELLETILYCSMDVVQAEASSVLLLDEEKRNFTFYQVEGPAKPLLARATFPADKGIAGSVMLNQESMVINNTAGDSRFYQDIDAQSGFTTRNMIAVPLVAGEERIGVLEVINKKNGGAFSDDEHLLLRSIAEEIAFAIRNAKIFDYVVNSYCKQRQGQASCKGCTRPLGSWTPCAKYRDATV
jgi:GAF domain-containing protein